MFSYPHKIFVLYFRFVVCVSGASDFVCLCWRAKAANKAFGIGLPPKMDSDFLPEKWFSFRKTGEVIFFLEMWFSLKITFLNASNKARVGKITFLNASDCRENKQTRGLILVILAIDLGWMKNGKKTTTGGFDPFCITCAETRGFDPLTHCEVLVWQGTGLPQDFQCLLYD